MPTIDPDALLLSRAQFGFTLAFHILFPTLTIGLSWFLATVEALWLKTRNPVYVQIYRLWVKVFALGFGMGVVSGIVMSYQFGTNFSRFSEIAGSVMGPLFSYEVLTAFFVEAGFIGVMLFGWDKVGPRLHFLATILVAVGTLNSSFWILAANSWMQTPQGTSLIDGRFVVDDWWAVVFNPSFPYRFSHMVIAAFLTTSFVVAGVSAWHLLRGEHGAVARRGLSLGLLLAAVLAPAQIFVGDQSGLVAKEHQPMKVAAMEGLWHTTRSAPLLLFAWPDQETQSNRFEIAIPRGASLILTHSLDGEVLGLNEVPRADQPPVLPVFWSFRIMVGLGVIMLAVAMWGLWQRVRGRMYDDRWLLRACVATIPAGFIATIAGWVAAEVGRQPYTVYGVLRTADSASPVTYSQVVTSLVLFVVVYGLLFAAFLYYVARVIAKGPDYEQALPEHPKAMRGARPASVIPAE
ncbi:MAG TPA: cytochrome ubiquinol oxidase subunit I [Alphaproteobacteria bacterium]